jgi:WD40 repeat protein
VLLLCESLLCKVKEVLFRFSFVLDPFLSQMNAMSGFRFVTELLHTPLREPELVPVVTIGPEGEEVVEYHPDVPFLTHLDSAVVGQVAYIAAAGSDGVLKLFRLSIDAAGVPSLLHLESFDHHVTAASGNTVPSFLSICLRPLTFAGAPLGALALAATASDGSYSVTFCGAAVAGNRTICARVPDPSHAATAIALNCTGELLALASGVDANFTVSVFGLAYTDAGFVIAGLPANAVPPSHFPGGNDITALAFHPRHPSIIAVGTDDGTAHLFDLRVAGRAALEDVMDDAAADSDDGACLQFSGPVATLAFVPGAPVAPHAGGELPQTVTIFTENCLLAVTNDHQIFLTSVADLLPLVACPHCIGPDGTFRSSLLTAFPPAEEVVAVLPTGAGVTALLATRSGEAVLSSPVDPQYPNCSTATAFLPPTASFSHHTAPLRAAELISLGGATFLLTAGEDAKLVLSANVPASPVPAGSRLRVLPGRGSAASRQRGFGSRAQRFDPLNSN